MLTTEQVQMIIIDMTLTPDDPPRVVGVEADELRAEMKKELAENKENGLDAALPES